MGEEGTTGIWWIEARDAAQNFIAHRIAALSPPPSPAQTKNYLVQISIGPKLRNPGLDAIAIIKYLKNMDHRKEEFGEVTCRTPHF